MMILQSLPTKLYTPYSDRVAQTTDEKRLAVDIEPIGEFTTA